MIALIDHPAAMQVAARAHRAAGLRVGLVPTMGALHAGHLSLVEAAARENDRVVVSIFVNPLQFGPGEDYTRYPRDLDRDLRLLEGAGCHAVFTAPADVLVPATLSTFVVNERLAGVLEGHVRPGHFRGVLTIVAKLFHLVLPDAAYFGRKDAQQALLVSRMVEDLHFPLDLRVLPIVREPDGLAMSSRNAYLAPEDRARALSPSRALRAARDLHAEGETRAGPLLAAARAALERQGVPWDYVELRDPATFEPLEVAGERALLLVAARVGTVRLLDNTVLGEPEPGL